jgi:hypothetical protein
MNKGYGLWQINSEITFDLSMTTWQRQFELYQHYRDWVMRGPEPPIILEAGEMQYV